jgi:hypothetical protein
MLSIKYIREHKTTIAIFLFLILFSLVHVLKPGIAYTSEGGFREFGLGYRKKTIIPIWIIAIVLAIFSYLFVVAYI